MAHELLELRQSTGAALCVECGKCSTMCPFAATGWFSAARLAAICDPVAEVSGQARALDTCLTCGACEIRCPQGVRFTDFVRGVRTAAPAAGRHPCPHGQMLQSAGRLMAGSHPPARDFSWLTEDLRVATEGELALFVGCLPLFDILFERQLGMETVEIARAAIRLLNRLGIEPVLLAEERCCGHDLLWNGEDEAFHALAAANAAAFEARGIRRILTTCAECCRTWRVDYPQAAPSYRPKVEHLAEFLAARIDAGELAAAPGNGATVTYQDPCRLGRHLGVLDAPRRVLGALGHGEVEEMSASGRDAVCCGTSGFVHCDAESRRMQTERLRAAAATGADKLITACPKCFIHFNCAQSEDRQRRRREPQIELQDLTVLAATALESVATTTAGAKTETGEA